MIREGFAAHGGQFGAKMPSVVPEFSDRHSERSEGYLFQETPAREIPRALQPSE
jgi:hypothetical protein